MLSSYFNFTPPAARTLTINRVLCDRQTDALFKLSFHSSINKERSFQISIGSAVDHAVSRELAITSKTTSRKSSRQLAHTSQLGTVQCTDAVLAHCNLYTSPIRCTYHAPWCRGFSSISQRLKQNWDTEDHGRLPFQEKNCVHPIKCSCASEEVVIVTWLLRCASLKKK